MKISILTPTYNRGKLLERLYNSLIENMNLNIEIEWIVIDDGSIDETEKIVKTWIKDNKIILKYYKQENQGKMRALNNFIKYATGDIIIECDSDDYFYNGAFKVIEETYQKHKTRDDIYGFCFLKYDNDNNNIGKKFKKQETTMFDLYFKEGEDGEKAIAFISKIRKDYEYEIEPGERFSTEARMFHKMDEKYKIICINSPIMICEYQNSGYTKNIGKVFLENPKGYYKYFKEILEKNMKGVIFSKRIYAIKHYILFSYITRSNKNLRNIKSFINKLIYIILYVPGRIKSKLFLERAQK